VRLSPGSPQSPNAEAPGFVPLFEHESLLRRYKEVLEERAALLAEQGRTQALSLDWNSLTQRLHDSELAYARLQASHAQLRARLEREKADLAALVGRAGAACTKISALRARNRELEDENARLQEALADADAPAVSAELQRAVDAMARELGALRARNAELSAAVERVGCATAVPADPALPALIGRLRADAAALHAWPPRAAPTEEEEEEEALLPVALADFADVETGDAAEEEDAPPARGAGHYAPLPADADDDAGPRRPHPLVQAIIDRQRQEEGELDVND
jgi:hypothetical protein